MSRFGSQETIQQALTTDFVEAIIDGLMAIVTLAMMFLYAPALRGVVARRHARSTALLRWALYTPLRRARPRRSSGRRGASHFLETVRGVQSIKLFDARRSAVALAEPGGRGGEPAPHDAEAAPGVFRTANGLLFAASSASSSSGSARCWCWTAPSRSACCSRSSPTRSSSRARRRRSSTRWSSCGC